LDAHRATAIEVALLPPEQVCPVPRDRLKFKEVVNLPGSRSVKVGHGSCRSLYAEDGTVPVRRRADIEGLRGTVLGEISR